MIKSIMEVFGSLLGGRRGRRAGGGEAEDGAEDGGGGLRGILGSLLGGRRGRGAGGILGSLFGGGEQSSPIDRSILNFWR